MDARGRVDENRSAQGQVRNRRNGTNQSRSKAVDYFAGMLFSIVVNVFQQYLTLIKASLGTLSSASGFRRQRPRIRPHPSTTESVSGPNRVFPWTNPSQRCHFLNFELKNPFGHLKGAGQRRDWIQ